jgi:hypothetical protein
MQLWASPIQRQNDTTYIIDEETGAILILPDTLCIRGLQHIDLSEASKVNLEVELVVSASTLGKFPHARRVRLVEQRPNFRPNDRRVKSLTIAQTGREWSYGVTFLCPREACEEISQLLKTDVGWLGVSVKGTSEAFNTAIVVAVFDFDEVLLGGVSRLESAAAQISRLKREVSSKVDSKMADELVDALLAGKRATLNVSGRTCKIALADSAELRAEAVRLQQRDEIIQINTQQLKFIEVVP